THAMRIRLAAGAVLAALGLLFGPSVSLAQPKGGAAKPAGHAAKPASAPAKAAPKAAAKPAAKLPKAPPQKLAPTKQAEDRGKKGERRGRGREHTRATTQRANPPRRIIAGIAAQKNVRESTELSEMRKIDLALFPGTAPDAGPPWPADGSPVTSSSEPKVSA